MRIPDVRPAARVAAISLRQPWASLMATGAKTIETRSWSTPCRGPLLICAAKRKQVGELSDLLMRRSFREGLGLDPIGWSLSSIRREIEALPFGQALALVNLSACWETGSFTPRAGEASFGDYRERRYGWITTERRRIKPFPVTGRQGLFRVTMPDFEEMAP